MKVNWRGKDLLFYFMFVGGASVAAFDCIWWAAIIFAGMAQLQLTETVLHTFGDAIGAQREKEKG